MRACLQDLTRGRSVSAGALTSPLQGGPGSPTVYLDGGSGAAGSDTPPTLLSVAPVEQEELLSDPVTTGAGSEQIWRKRRSSK